MIAHVNVYPAPTLVSVKYQINQMIITISLIVGSGDESINSEKNKRKKTSFLLFVNHT